jgi:ParB family transcriptional regulator, chromosome partitioning protein
LHKTATRKKKNDHQKTINIARVGVCPGHIRKSLSNIDGLKNTIVDVGLLQPILVRRSGDNFTVIDGARRLEALKALEVPELIVGRDVIIDLEETESDTRFKEIIANIQREDINDVELGHAFVTLNESYGYQYKEIAEIIGATPHNVAAKVGLAKRLTPEMQALVVKDMAEARCTPNTSEDPIFAYSMNINVIEDIARLQAALQKPAYEAIKAKEMDTKEALEYLRSIKRDAETLAMADDIKGLVDSYADMPATRESNDGGMSKQLKKLDKDLERLSVSFKSQNDIDKDTVVPALELLIERLNALYAEVKLRDNVSGSFVPTE